MFLTHYIPTIVGRVGISRRKCIRPLYGFHPVKNNDLTTPRGRSLDVVHIREKSAEVIIATRNEP
jgi:hypothetical protein